MAPAPLPPRPRRCFARGAPGQGCDLSKFPRRGCHSRPATAAAPERRPRSARPTDSAAALCPSGAKMSARRPQGSRSSRAGAARDLPLAAPRGTGRPGQRREQRPPRRGDPAVPPLHKRCGGLAPARAGRGNRKPPLSLKAEQNPSRIRPRVRL